MSGVANRNENVDVKAVFKTLAERLGIMRARKKRIKKKKIQGRIRGLKMSVHRF